jgi:hypothetical protein
MKDALRNIGTRGRDFLLRPIVEQPVQHRYPDAGTQLQLQLSYQALQRSGCAMPTLAEVGFKALSQTDEDGVLLYVFSLLGAGKKTAVELCAGDGIECNTANLIVNHGWHALLVDGDERQIERGTEFFRRHPNTYVYPPVFKHAWVTRDNVNAVIAQSGFSGEIDLLSIDMDGVDYWIWDAIDCVDPRVVVVEYQDILGPDKSLTVPYSDTFNAYTHPTTDGMPNYCGASLAAFVKLAKTRGYRLVGCNRLGYNAFFVKNPLAQRELPEVETSSCFAHAKNRWGMEHRFPLVSYLPWVEV